MLQALEAEMSIIGCIMLDEKKVFSELPPKCFENEDLRKVFELCKARVKSGQAVDFPTLAGLTGQAEPLARCLDMVSNTAMIDQYTEVVIDAYRTRELVKTCQKVLETANGELITADELLEEVARQMEYQRKIAQSRKDDRSKEFVDAVVEYFDHLYAEKPKSWQTGFPKLNRTLGGIKPSTLTVLAGRSGHGKTDFAINLTLNLARQCRVLYMSMEMTTSQILERIASKIAAVDSFSLRDGKLMDEEKKRIQAKFDELVGKGTNLVIDESAQVTLEQLERKIEKVRPDVLIVDHVGLMKGNDKKQRWEVFTEISQGLKQFALQKGIAVIALAQQTSDVEKRKNKSANMSDVKGTDSFSNDADTMIFISAEREAPEGSKWLNAKLQLVKNRNGNCGKIALHWMPTYHDYIEVQD